MLYLLIYSINLESTKQFFSYSNTKSRSHRDMISNPKISDDVDMEGFGDYKQRPWVESEVWLSNPQIEKLKVCQIFFSSSSDQFCWCRKCWIIDWTKKAAILIWIVFSTSSNFVQWILSSNWSLLLRWLYF